MSGRLPRSRTGPARPHTHRDDVAQPPSPLRPSSRLALLAAVTLLTTTGPATLAAQGQPDAIPIALVHALMQSSATRITVGALPAGWPSDLVPAAPAGVFGGSEQRGTLVAVFADSTGSPLARFQDRLEGAGWTRPTLARGEGFMSSGTAGSFYCRDSMRVSPVMIRGGAAPHLLHVRLYKAGSERSCGGDPMPPRPREATVLTIPTLTPPAGASMQGSGSGSGMTGVNTGGVVTDATRGGAALATHFAAQLKAAGWTVATPIADGRVAAVALDARDSTAAPWHGVLLIVSRGSRHSATLTMNPVEAR